MSSLFKKKKVAEKREEVKSHIEKYKELSIALVYTYGTHNTCTMTCRVDCDDAVGFEQIKKDITDNLGANYILETGNGAHNLKYFCSVTFEETEVSEIVIDD